MRKNLLFVIAFLMLALLFAPAFAWYYNDIPTPTNPSLPPHDQKFETFGPRCDRILIQLFSTAEQEWESLLATPQLIDMTDWPLTQEYYDKLKVVPEINRTNLVSSGGEFGIRCLDINQNPNRYAGAPPDPDYPNPVANLNDTDPSNDYNPTSDLNFRKAILSCIDRDHYIANIIGTLSGVDLWCCLPPATGAAYYNDTYMKTMYPFSLENARAWLNNATHGFKLVGAKETGWRYWDLDDDNVEDDNEYVNLKFVIRSDDTHRKLIGIHIADKLNEVGIRVNRMFLDISGARTQWMDNKDANLYTAGWSLGIEPDSIVLWMGDAGLYPGAGYYWHPGRCYNTAYANDAEFNVAAGIVEVAGSEQEAIDNMVICNRRAAEAAINGPLFCYSSVMANARKYCGTLPEESAYTGQYWRGTTCVIGYGIDSYFGFMNMKPTGTERPENSTIRYAFKTADIRSFNNIYAEWVWDNAVLDLTYDSLVASNPYSLTTRMPWMCSDYVVGSYIHPTLGNCTKVVFTLRPDMTWTDGTPITMNDVYFTLVEIKGLLKARGFANAWWYSAVKNILSFTQLDPYTFEILINVYSIWAFGLTGAGVRIMPKHIWEPICKTGDPTGIAPDPNMISSGPWRFREYKAAGYVDLVANKPGRTVTTSHTGSTPVTSPKGYFKYYPIEAIITTPAGLKFEKCDHTLTVTLKNNAEEPVRVNKNVTITFANGTKIDLVINNDVTIPGKGSYKEEWTFCWPWGKHWVEVSIHIKEPAWLECTMITVKIPFWVTIKEDIGGAMQDGVTAPDIRVEGKDIAVASKAFGTKPGDARWSAVADVTGDYRVEGKDIARLARTFGWRPT